MQYGFPVFTKFICEMSDMFSQQSLKNFNKLGVLIPRMQVNIFLGDNLLLPPVIDSLLFLDPHSHKSLGLTQA